MSDLNRRDALKTAAVALGVTAAGGVAFAAEADEKEAMGSGETAAQPAVTELTLDASKAEVHILATGLSCFFSRISPDAAPGRNTLTISGLAANTRCITVWMTEWSAGNKPHAGGAFFYTSSVQLYDNGTKCRVIFNLDWSRHLPAACQVIYGHA
ncbi:MAG: hypothetical protein M3552_19845 [Planctomycetota bacterium]|nr:hypothetical protein [Planctomycetaceae bacterium]MDQ3332871.1 hypothetical protein [Planctomycetota bacterium]